MDKLTRLLISRLQQDARRKTKRHALMNGLLSLKIVEAHGTLVRRYVPAFDLSVLSGDPASDVSLIRKRFASFLKEPPKPHEQGATDMQDAARDPMPQLRSPLTWGRVPPRNESASSGVTRLPARNDAAGLRTDPDRGRANRDYAVRIVGEAAEAPVSGDMIAALLLARAIRHAGLSLASVVDLVRSPASVVAIQSAVSGLEPHLIRLLECTQFLPGEAITFADASITMPDGSFDLERTEGRRPVVHFDRYSTKHMSGAALTRRLVRALGRDIPVLATSEYPMRLADVVRIGADLILTVAKVDKSVITDLTSLFHGEAGPVALAALPDDFDPRGLSMDDLLLAFRPGRSPAETMRVLTNLAALNKPTQDDEKDDDDGSGDVNGAASKSVTDGNGDGAGDGSSWSAKPKDDHKKPTDRSSLRRDKPSGAEVIQPTPINRAEDAAAKAKPPVTVEALSGYGRAKDWALGLKQDLADYVSGELAWADMSTKLLLSGPPGTGKTTFATALCNTLQIPLIVTSVSTWLEGAYLNDVIARMAKTFEEARELSPSILFVDEIDGIGKRQSSEKEHADYWNALINKALELLDGTVKAEGVIVVGATNRPQQIDEALRRSGRLETHIEIPRPDIETLVGILAHHLGDDVDHLLTEYLNSGGPAPTQLEAEAGPEMPHAIANDDARADADETGSDAGNSKRGIGQ
jgi:hypothetical protein